MHLHAVHITGTGTGTGALSIRQQAGLCCAPCEHVNDSRLVRQKWRHMHSVRQDRVCSARVFDDLCDVATCTRVLARQSEQHRDDDVGIVRTSSA